MTDIIYPPCDGHGHFSRDPMQNTYADGYMRGALGLKSKNAWEEFEPSAEFLEGYGHGRAEWIDPPMRPRGYGGVLFAR